MSGWLLLLAPIIALLMVEFPWYEVAKSEGPAIPWRASVGTGWVPGTMWGAMWIFSFGWPLDVEVVRTEIVSNFQKT